MVSSKLGIRRALAGSILLLACDAGGPRAPFRQLDSTSTLAPASFRAPVKLHAMHGARIRDAVARGDLAGVHEASRALRELILSTEQPAPQTMLGEVVTITRSLESVEDVPTAAAKFAMLAERCGACHTAFGGPRSVPAEAPPDTAGIEARMRRHQWGASRLWEGLVAPSEEAWRSGAIVLSDAALASELPAGTSHITELEKLSGSVHDIGAKAGSATSPHARSELYGQLLATCASCHGTLGGGPSGPKE